MSRATTTIWLGAFASVLVAGCGGSDESVSVAVQRWLLCTECFDGERDSVAALGSAAIPALREALLGPSPTQVSNVRAQEAGNWSATHRIVDSASYVSRLTENFEATVQRRSAVSLADIGTAPTIALLDSAIELHDSGATRYRDDALREIYRALYRARGFVEWRVISPASAYTCGTLTSGRALCWGDGSDGRLGNGATTGVEPRPTLLSGVPGFSSIATGTDFACGTVPSGRAYCWGSRDRGQLARGEVDADPRPFPDRVSDVSLRVLVAGSGHACGLDRGGGIVCWGDGRSGQLGRGPPAGVRATPAGVTLPAPVISAASGGEHTCALTDTNEAWCWGRNGSGQLGDGTTSDRSAPVRVQAGSLRFTAVSAGAAHTCALTLSHEIYCWGEGSLGELGDGGAVDSPVPVAVDVSGIAGTVPFFRVSAGVDHTCAIRADGSAFCWGSRDRGRLGDGRATGSADTPVPLAPTIRWREVRAGEHTCGIAVTGLAYCWGPGSEGQLGDGTSLDRLVPTRVAEPEG